MRPVHYHPLADPGVATLPLCGGLGWQTHRPSLVTCEACKAIIVEHALKPVCPTCLGRGTRGGFDMVCEHCNGAGARPEG